MQEQHLRLAGSQPDCIHPNNSTPCLFPDTRARILGHAGWATVGLVLAYCPRANAIPTDRREPFHSPIGTPLSETSQPRRLGGRGGWTRELVATAGCGGCRQPEGPDETPLRLSLPMTDNASGSTREGRSSQAKAATSTLTSPGRNSLLGSPLISRDSHCQCPLSGFTEGFVSV